MRKPGKYIISNTEYHADKDYYSSSILKEALVSPAHFKYYVLQGHKEQAESRAKLIGTLVHTVLLEPHLFDEQFIIYEGDTNKDDSIPAKELKLLIDKHGDSKDFISKAEYQFAMQARANTLAYPDAAKYVFSPDGESEPSFFGICQETGLPLKFRPDRIDVVQKFMCDPKTAMSADRNTFKKVIKYDRHYDLSAYMYLKQAYEHFGFEFDWFWHVIGKEKMCPIAVYKASKQTLEDGKEKFFRACDNIKTALAMPDLVLFQNKLEVI